MQLRILLPVLLSGALALSACANGNNGGVSTADTAADSAAATAPADAGASADGAGTDNGGSGAMTAPAQ